MNIEHLNLIENQCYITSL